MEELIEFSYELPFFVSETEMGDYKTVEIRALVTIDEQDQEFESGICIPNGCVSYALDKLEVFCDNEKIALNRYGDFEAEITEMLISEFEKQLEAFVGRS